MAALVGFPMRARAAAPALPIIGYAATIAAFLAACGIYPFQDEHGQSFGEWGARKLTELWDTYITEIYPTSEAAQVISDVKSFYVNGGYITMARDTWDKLRSFAGWMQRKYALAANEVDVRIGESSYILLEVPTDSYILVTPRISGSSSWSSGETKYRAKANNAGVFVGYYKSGNNFCGLMLSSNSFTWNYGWSNGYNSGSNAGSSVAPGYAYYYAYPTESKGESLKTIGSWYNPDIPWFDSKDALIDAFTGGNVNYTGIVADTGAVSVPDELPEGAEMGGLAVAGAGATAETLRDVIEQGVMERQRPIVKPVTVEIGEGTQVDAGTGTVAAELPDTITITPDSVPVPLSVSDYAVPGLSELFPFSVPWDIARVWQALDAEPRWFLEDYVLTWDIPELWGGAPLVVTFRMEDMPQQVQDAVQGLARTVRAFLLIIACIGFLIFAAGFIKF